MKLKNEVPTPTHEITHLSLPKSVKHGLLL